MAVPSCPIEFTLWWCQRYHRKTACVWSPDAGQVELFSTICQLRAQAWSNRFGDLKAGKWSILGKLSSSDQPNRSELIRDVLVAEPMVRLLAATSKSIRAGAIRQQVYPALHGAFVAVRQARCVALENLLQELDRGAIWARSLNRLRITIEQWTDLLLGVASAHQQVPVVSLQAYGFRAERIREFAFEASEADPKLSGMLGDWFMLQGVRRTMRSFGPQRILHPEWDSQLRHLAKGFLGPASFRDAHLSQSLQIEQRFEALEHWFSMLGDARA